MLFIISARMDGKTLVISGGNPSFHNCTFNLYPNRRQEAGLKISGQSEVPLGSSVDRARQVFDQPEYLDVTHCQEEDFHAHRGEAEKFYQISRHPKGSVLIINNEFHGQNHERIGSPKDRFDMVTLWEEFGCKVTTASDLSAKKLLETVKEFASHKLEADFCVLIVMSHGKHDDLVLGSKKGLIEVKQIVDAVIRSESFKDKPKLIFFQMCRGEKIEKDQLDAVPNDDCRRGVSGASTFDTSDSTWVMSVLQNVLDNGWILGSTIDEPDQDAKEYISKTPDVLLAFGTQSDYKSFRNKNGSWFIQSIKKAFSKFAATEDVVTLMERVKIEVDRYKAQAPGKPHDGGKATVDAANTFGNKVLKLFPGFPSPIPE